MASLVAAASVAQAQDKIGVVLMHGKQGSPGGLRVVASALEGKGCIAVVPSMPWGADWHAINVDVPGVHVLIDGHIAKLRSQGATRIVVGGHSLGANMALSYAVARGDVAAVVMAAPGHNPFGWSRSIETIRKDVERAGAMVQAGQGGQSFTGHDSNQGNNLTLTTTAAVYLSWMSPRGPASMQAQAPNLPARIPVFVVMGEKDMGIGYIENAVYKPAAKHPYSKYLTNGADHAQTPLAANKQIAEWVAGLPR